MSNRAVGAGPDGSSIFRQPHGRLEQWLKYGTRVYPVFSGLAGVGDDRPRPQIPARDVLEALFFAAALRLPSLNALEGELQRPAFQRLLGHRAQAGHKLFSSDTISRVLKGIHLDPLRQLLPAVVHSAERKKVFRQGPRGTRRPVAVDGWEPFCSYARHCPDCLVRNVRRQGDRVPQYYHRFVVALLLAGDAEVVLDVEPLRPADQTRPGDTHEGEPTAALRLIDRLHEQYGRLIDLFVLDALYPTGPVMKRITDLGYGAVITLKQPNQEPLKDALVLMEGRPHDLVWDEPGTGARAEAWDVDEIEALDTYRDKIRVVRVELTSPSGPKRTWCAAVVGSRPRRLPIRTVHSIQRLRWHIENTAFNQWTQQWKLTHVYCHKPRAVVAVLVLWIVAFNLMQLFVYRRLRRPRVPRDPCNTIRDLVAELAAAVARLTAPVSWRRLLDTS